MNEERTPVEPFDEHAAIMDAEESAFHPIEDEIDSRPTAPTWRDRVRDFFGMQPDTSRRLYALTHAINIAPKTAVNYVLRGELYLERRQAELAAEDFATAYRLAEAELQRSGHTLGLLAQTIQDRALTGYEDAIRRGENGYNQEKRKVD